MKYFSLLTVAFFILISSCEPNVSSGDNAEKEMSRQPEKPDSVLIEEINNYVSFVEQSYSTRQKNVVLDPPTNKEQVYWIENDRDEYFRVMYGIYSMNPYFKYSFYLKNNEIIYFRYQEWIRTETPKIGNEFLCHLDKGRIIKSAKKHLVLEGDEPPQKLPQLPYLEVKINQDSMVHVIEDVWKMVLEKKSTGEQMQDSTSTNSK